MMPQGDNEESSIFDRAFWRQVILNLVSAFVIAAMFYVFVGVFGFKFPKGAGVPPGIAAR